MPMWLDQVDNLAVLIEKGIALGLNVNSAAEDIYYAVTEVRDNKT